MKEMPFALEAEAISFTYPDGFVALREIVFRVRKGEFVAMLASNGSGKTTLIKILSGLLHPQIGTLRVDGKLLREYSQEALYQRLGLVFQNPNDQLFGATVEEDVAFGPRNLGLGEEEVQRRVAESLQAVGAGELGKRAIHHLSYGQQKRVAIAGVLAMKPSILILDEPTAGLDPLRRNAVFTLISRAQREFGFTAVVVTHDLPEALAACDHIAFLDAGRIRFSGTPATFINSPDAAVSAFRDSTSSLARDIAALHAGATLAPEILD